jgi:N-acetylneuraminic acid mutarotase
VIRTCLAAPLAGLLAGLLAGCTEVEPPPRPETPWSEAPEMPGARIEAAVAALGSQLVVAGGFSTSTGEITREVIALDTFTGAWTELPELPVAWTRGALAASGGTLYLLGGLEGPSFVARGEAYALDPGADAWRDLPPMPAGQERGAAAVVASPPHIYLIGGSSTAGALASVLDYNLATSMWTQLPDLPVPRSHAAAMRVRDGTLIVAGGLADRTGAPLDDVHALPLGAAVWEPRRPMPTPRGGCAYGQALGWLTCAGGAAGSSALRGVEAYDPIADVWMTLPELPVARAGAQGAVIGQQLYIPGGAGSLVLEPTRTVLVLSLIDALAR